MVAVAVEPVAFRLLSIGHYVECAISQILLSQFEGSLKFDFFHAAIFWGSIDVGGKLVYSLVSIELSLGSNHDVLSLPFFVDIYNCLWFILE